MNRLFVYVRVSTDGQADNTSPEEQRRKGMAVADYHGAEVAGVFEDLAVSGAMPFAERPEGAKLWAQLQAGDVVCAAKLDRLFRSAEDAFATSRQLKERGVDLIVADLSVDPITQNGVGKLIFGMMAQFAEFERERIAERTRDGIAAKKARGGFAGGRRPFGFDVTGAGRDAQLVPNEAEQAAIRDIKVLAEVGESTRVIAAKVKAAHKIDISHVTVAKILKTARGG